MTTYLSMNGTSDYLSVPSLTYDKIIITADVLGTGGTSPYYLFDSISRTTNGFVRVNATTLAFDVSFSPDTISSSGNVDTITMNGVKTASTTFFASTAPSGYVKGNIYDIQFFNGGVLQAHYDMSIGNVQDTSGNGHNATLVGGTWVSGGPTSTVRSNSTNIQSKLSVSKPISGLTVKSNSSATAILKNVISLSTNVQSNTSQTGNLTVTGTTPVPIMSTVKSNSNVSLASSVVTRRFTSTVKSNSHVTGILRNNIQMASTVRSLSGALAYVTIAAPNFQVYLRGLHRSNSFTKPLPVTVMRKISAFNRSVSKSTATLLKLQVVNNMIEIIRFKRGNKANLPSLQLGEPAITQDTNELYVGMTSGNVKIPTQPDLDSVNTSLAEKSPKVKTDSWLDVIADYNASGSIQSTTGNINASSNILTLSSAIDFKNGQGIAIAGAGASCSLTTPNAPTVNPQGTTGTTTYQYQVVAMDGKGGYTAASPVTTITNGNATLSSTNYNNIQWTPVTGAVAYIVYGTIGGSWFPMANTTVTSFNDNGTATYSIWGLNSNTPPAISGNQTLFTTISSGGGTATLTLTNNATTSVSSAKVYHDDTLAIQNALNNGSSVKIPAGSYNISSTLIVDSRCKVSGEKNSSGHQSTLKSAATLCTAMLQVASNGSDDNANYFKFGLLENIMLDGYADGTNGTRGGADGIHLGVNGAASGTNEANDFVIRDCNIANFTGNGIVAYANTYLCKFYNTSINMNQLNGFYYAGGTNSGENISFYGCCIFGNRLNNVQMNAGGDLNFFGTSIDYANGNNLVLNTNASATVRCFGCHFEGTTSLVYLNNGGNKIELWGCTFVLASTTPSGVAGIVTNGNAEIILNGGKFTNMVGSLGNSLSISSTGTNVISRISGIGGTYPKVNTLTIASATLYQNDYFGHKDIYVPITFNPTGTNSASVTVSMGVTTNSNNVIQENIPAGYPAGDTRVIRFRVPTNWYYQVNVTNATIGSASYIQGQ